MAPDGQKDRNVNHNLVLTKSRYPETNPDNSIFKRQ